MPLQTGPFATLFGDTTAATLKLELFQHAGSFKARGNLLGIDRLSDTQRAAGVVAASGGNHALAVAWAARERGIDATVVMPEATDGLRVSRCRELGARVVLVKRIGDAFGEMERIAATDGATIMHPFEGEHMTLGAATLGAEIAEDFPEVDVMVVAVGGGGLIGGLAAALREMRPDSTVIGVEPTGADSLSRSFEAGHAVAIDSVDTIADSLGSPTALPFSYSVARAHVSRLVRIDDRQIVDAMRLMRDALHMTVEPACAAAMAAAAGPLREELAGANVCILACGSNISTDRYRLLIEGN